MAKIIYDKLFDRMKQREISSYRTIKDKVVSERTFQRIREGKSVTLKSIASLCKALECQPGDILEYIDEEWE